jgi:hypothetical protein
MGHSISSKPFVCRIGLHDWQAVPEQPDRFANPHRTPFVVVVECRRCSTRKMMPLSTGHEQSGPV